MSSYKTIEELNAALPHGSRRVIAEITGLSHEYVSKVLHGKAFNLAVIEAALQMAQSHDPMSESVANRIKQALNSI